MRRWPPPRFTPWSPSTISGRSTSHRTLARTRLRRDGRGASSHDRRLAAAPAAEEPEALLETEDAPAEFVVPEPAVGEEPSTKGPKLVSPGGHG